MRDIPRDDFDGGDGQAGGVLQVAGETQPTTSPWLGQVQAEPKEGEHVI